MKHKYECAIVGIRGYSGLELARVLSKHPAAKLVAGFATDAAFEHESVPILPLSALEETARKVKTVFLATPIEVSAELAPRCLAAGADVIDLSGAFRQDPKAQYGLVPWCGPAKGPERDNSNAPRLIANPGCYATAVLMATVPLLKAEVIRPEILVIDAKSGTTGAGRKAAENLIFSEVEGDCRPYRVGKHQHLPEITAWAQAFSGQAIDPMFTTHLLPVRRGIVAGIYARLNPDASAKAVEGAYASAYAAGGACGGAYRDYPLVRWKEGENFSLRTIVGSARTQIQYTVNGNKLYVFSYIDNLLKGAASQAVENFNRLYDLPVTAALTELEGVL
jgi:N-acetyl-gamma-glutamyl-phosphate reductase